MSDIILSFQDCLQELDVSILDEPCPLCHTTHPRYLITGNGFTESPAMMIFLLEATPAGIKRLSQPASIVGDQLIDGDGKLYGKIQDLAGQQCRLEIEG